ncbi:sigma-70 family RNA polymerase sigma factor [Streptomyces sp. NPDC005907]|uniref:sigma-70 family RNA polymerase sigma factor n=1 Tax=Streptomyces sp. NPDC005907 TaxID=3154571 RepID=UPI0033FB6863
MSVDGRGESPGGGGTDSGAPAARRVPGQGRPPRGDDRGASADPGEDGSPHSPHPSVPPQRERHENGVLAPPSDRAPLNPPPSDPATSGPGASGPVTSDPPSSDADLIARMRAGDDTAYEALYRRHAGAVRRYARTCCRDGHTADDLTAEVFARVLQAVRGGSGPQHAVRAYLLTTVRRVAAHWTKTAKREQLVDDFAVFAAQAERSPEVSGDDTLDLGADVLAMREAEQSMAVRAFRSLPERWQAVLWHTEVEDESPSEVATLFGLDANGTRVLASRAREGLRQAYLQAHVSTALIADEECARYADRLGAHARGGLRTRAERGLRKHLEECAKCRLAARQIKEVAGGIPAVVPVAVIGWFGAAGYAKAVALVAGGTGAGAAGATGAAVAAGGGSGGAAASEGLGAPAKAAVAAGVVAVAAAAVAHAQVGDDSTVGKPEARPAASHAVESPAQVPAPKPPKPPKPPKRATARPPLVPAAAAPAPTPAPAPPPSSAPPKAESSPGPTGPKPQPRPTPPPWPDPEPTPPPPPAPVPTVYRWNELRYGLTGDGTEPEMRLGESSWVWQRWGVSVGGREYARGVTVHGRSSVTIDLNRDCSAYDAVVGVDDMTRGLGKVRFSVYADGVRLWRSPLLAGGDRAVPVHVDLTNRRTIRLAVDPGTPFDAVAPVDWADAGFSCR